MPTYYNGELCYTLEEAQALGREEIYKQAEILRANLRKAKNNELDYA